MINFINIFNNIKTRIQDKEYDTYKPIVYNKIDPNLFDMAINHEKLWRWIAKRTREQHRKVTKYDYFIYYKVKKDQIPNNHCYACEYKKLTNTDCCILNWEGYFCFEPNSYYSKWKESNNWIEAYYWANKIANLKDNEEFFNKKDLEQLQELLDKGYKYIARNKNLQLYIYKDKVVKDQEKGIWIRLIDDGTRFEQIENQCYYIDCLRHITWEDAHCTKIEDLIEDIKSKINSSECIYF